MKRLFQGAPTGRITRPRSWHPPSWPQRLSQSFASDPSRVPGQDTHVKTLSPLPSNEARDTNAVAAAPDTTPLPDATGGDASPPLKPALQYSADQGQAAPSTPAAMTTSEADRAKLRETADSAEPISADSVKKDLISPAAPEVTDSQLCARHYQQCR